MTEKIKITVRFVVEQDFEVEVADPELGLGSVFCVGDNMVSSGYDIHNLTTQENIFDNPVSEVRPFQGKHFWDANLYTLGVWDKYTLPWLKGGEEDADPYEEDEEDE